MNRQRKHLRNRDFSGNASTGRNFQNSISKILFSALTGLIVKDISSKNSKLKLMFNKIFQIGNSTKTEKRKIIKTKFEEIKGDKENEEQN